VPASQTGYKVKWSQGFIVLRQEMCHDFHVKDHMNIALRRTVEREVP